MEKSNQTKTQPTTEKKPVPSLDTLMHMGIYIPSDIPVESLTEQGKELVGIKSDK